MNFVQVSPILLHTFIVLKINLKFQQLKTGIVGSPYLNIPIESINNKHFEPVLVCCGFFLTVR